MRAIDEGQAFLGAKRNRCEACSGESLGAGHDPALILRLAMADQHRRHVGEWRKIAGGTHRTLGWNDGGDAPRQHPFHQFDQFPANARGAPADAQELQNHQEARMPPWNGGTHTAAMRQDQIAL